jgi:hypothetical protein
MKTNSSPNLLGSLSNIDGKQKKGKENFPGGASQPSLAVQDPTPTGMHALAARALHARPGRPHMSHAATSWRLTPCMQGQAGPTCPTRPQDGAGTCVKAMVSDHAPLHGGRGLLAPRGPPSAGLQASGPSFVSSSTKFNS